MASHPASDTATSAASSTILHLLSQKGNIIIDGALATELEARGCDLNHPVWSAKVLVSQPALVQQVHYDYFVAGADVAITASYQATPAGLADAYGMSEAQACEAIATSARLAMDAREQVRRLQPQRCMLVAGSVGPYGAFLSDGSEYRGDYVLSSEQFKRFHRARIRALVNAGVDVLACETLPSFAEAEALLSLLREEWPETAAWCSFTLRDEDHISDGSSLCRVCELLNPSQQVVAVGVNCVPQNQVAGALRRLRTLTQKPLLAYPNSGEVYDAEQKVWHGVRDEDSALADLVSSWHNEGAAMIGGCCRTTPEDIKIIHKTMRSDNV